MRLAIRPQPWRRRLTNDVGHNSGGRAWEPFQSLLRGSIQVAPLEKDYHFWQTDVFSEPGYPVMHFVEHRYSHDPTNWWIPNRACAEAMLRSAGFEIVDHPEEEVYICKTVPCEVSREDLTWLKP
jgi:tRNA (mo5U34)-methyltransferase